jgi:glycosyltransferase involved in cell wall biosynthesis
MTPRVTVGLPVYNGERFLGEAIESILAQEFSDFELIISDNASDDGTATICERYARRDRRVRFSRLESNRGGAGNYNRVFSLATGAYFKWAAHDDVLAPAHLKLCVAALDCDTAAVIAYPRTILIGEDGRELREYADNMDLPFPRPSQRLRRVMRCLHEPNALFGLIRADALRRTRLMGRHFRSDYVLVEELALLGRFREVPEPLFYRRMHPAMCCRANPTPRQQAAWFDPLNRNCRVLPWCRFTLEQLKAVRHVPMSRVEKARCYMAVAEDVLRRSGKRMARELLCTAARLDAREAGLETEQALETGHR